MRHRNKNAEKHGILSSELKISDNDRAEFGQTKEWLAKGLSAQGVLEELALDDVLSSLWRYKLALRNEQAKISCGDGTPRNEADGVDLLHIRTSFDMYSATRRKLLQAIQLLRGVADDSTCGHIREEHLEQLGAIFGEDFVSLLTSWAPTAPFALVLAESMIDKQKMHDLTPVKPDPGRLKEAKREILNVEDSLRAQMLSKLFALELRHLVQVYESVEKLARSEEGHRADPLELALRYQTTARRDFYRALDRFRDLQSHRDKN